MEEILRIFPIHLQSLINKHIALKWTNLQEIRLRVNAPVELNFSKRVDWLESHIFTLDDRNYVLSQLSEHSLYRLETEMQEGFITIAGGHRVGLAGKVVSINGEIKGLQQITSFNIRVAQQSLNIAQPLLPYLTINNNYVHTLFIGPPKSGKTTLLRDVCRLISDGTSKYQHKKVAIIDERSEIAAAKDGVPQFNVGKRTDVMDACPKAIGMMMMIRSMSPDVMIVDEIGKQEDVQALLDVFHAGIALMCTAHASSIEEVQQRLSLRPLFKEAIFQRLVVLSFCEVNGFTYEVYNSEAQLLVKKR
ncbi:MAG TPA: stage III sporulation protein AA [Pseudogracilibacillus sp.]|nr:stage III sporulation protein AA [Pseudogracilibacillus sp.]